MKHMPLFFFAAFFIFQNQSLATERKITFNSEITITKCARNNSSGNECFPDKNQKKLITFSISEDQFGVHTGTFDILTDDEGVQFLTRFKLDKVFNGYTLKYDVLVYNGHVPKQLDFPADYPGLVIRSFVNLEDYSKLNNIITQTPRTISSKSPDVTLGYTLELSPSIQ